MTVRSEEVEVVYRSGETELHGFLVWDAARKERRPGVLVVHEWWGHDEYVRFRARQLAGAGYVAMAVDMYGQGRVARSREEAQSLMMQVVGDPQAMRARFEAALGVLIEHEVTDKTRIAAIGYCFGGSVVLEMARAGLDLRAVASFHPGSLATRNPARRETLRARVLAALGEDDPFISREERESFRREMTGAGADFELVTYPGVVHAFTVQAATERGKKYGLPLAYDPNADRDSWVRLERQLQRAFA